MIWVGTQNGLTRMDPRTRRFKTYDTHDGLPGNTISCITDDSKGNLWMSTNHGLSRLNPGTGTFENYSDSDGLPGNDFTGWSTCHKGHDGELFFGGFAGAVGFYPDKLTETREGVPIVLTALEVAGETERVGDGGPLDKSITYAAAITLTHQQNEFSLRFAGLHYANPFSNRYRYRLLGLDHDWIEVDSSSRRASYTTLPRDTTLSKCKRRALKGPGWSPASRYKSGTCPRGGPHGGSAPCMWRPAYQPCGSSIA